MFLLSHFSASLLTMLLFAPSFYILWEYAIVTDYRPIKCKMRFKNTQRAKKILSSDYVLLMLFYFSVDLRVLNSLILLEKLRDLPRAQGSAYVSGLV